MNSPASPLDWPEDFPPKSQLDAFFMGVPALGPDLSFFKDLYRQQGSRTEEVLAAWTDEREQRIARSLGECLQEQLGWKKPYFTPADRVRAVVGGPDWWGCLEMELTDLFEALNEKLGRKMKDEFWKTVIDWEDKDACLGELVHKLAAEINP